jgi:hypothetical protein
LIDFVIEKDDAAWTLEINPYKGRIIYLDAIESVDGAVAVAL